MIDDLIEYFGGHSRMAAALGVSTQAVSQWSAKGKIPPARAIEIELITDGLFRAVDIKEAQNDE